MQLTKRVFPATAIIAAFVSLLVAPQFHILRNGASPAFVLGLSVVAAIGLAFISIRAIKVIDPESHRLPLLLGLAILPLLFLWAMPVGYPERLGHLPHLWLCAGTLILIAGVFVVSSARCPGSRRDVIVAASTTVVALGSTEIFRSMTPEATIPAALIWGLYVLASMVGWGVLINRILLPEQAQDWGQRAAFGLAFLVVLGGVLNLSWSISPRVIETVLALGFGLWAAELPGFSVLKPEFPKFDAVVLLALIIAIAALVQLGAAAAGSIDTVFAKPAFDLHDDQQAYLVFPEKMLQLGSMGPEPFEARRMLSMGGQSFLQTIILVVLPLRSLHLIEMGIAPLILLGLIIGYGRAHGFDRRIVVFMALFVLAIPHLAMRGNTSAMLTGIVLFLSWFRLLDDRDKPAPPTLLALVIAALVALKSTFIPAAVTIFAITTLFALIDKERRKMALADCAITTIFIAVFCLPWMISILSSSGTLLYPIFGRGYYGGIFTDDFSNIAATSSPAILDVVRSSWRHLVPLLPSFLLIVFIRQRPRARASLALLLAAIISIICIVVMGDPEIHRAISRYSFPITTATIIAMLLSAFREDDQKRLRQFSIPVIAALTIGLGLMLINQDNIHKNWDQIIVNLFNAASAPDANSPAVVAAHRLIDEALGEHDTLLATLEHPSLLDFTRRQTFIMSLPGMAMLPPGMPIFGGHEKVAEYLLAKEIPLLAYGGIGDEQVLLKLTDSDIRNRYPNSKMRWIMLRYHQQFNRVVEKLASTRKRLYEDSHRVVLDLRHRVYTFSPALHPERTHGFLDNVWTDPVALIEDLERRPDDRVLILRTFSWRPASLDRSVPELIADVYKLEFIRRSESAFAYRLPPEVPETFDLEIRSDAFSLSKIGAHETAFPLGIDVRAIEIGEDDDLVSIPIRTLLQPITGEITPEKVWNKSGFFADFNWTGGDGIFEDLDWPVPHDACSLTVELYPVHPSSKKPEDLSLRISINNIELKLDSMSENTFVFSLFDGLATINRLRFESSTIVPQKLGLSNDNRHLGVPIKIIRFDSPF